MKERILSIARLIAALFFGLGVLAILSGGSDNTGLIGISLFFSGFLLALLIEVVKQPPRINLTLSGVPSLVFTCFAIPCYIVGAITLVLTLKSLLAFVISRGEPGRIVAQRAILSLGMLVVGGIITFLCLALEKATASRKGTFEQNAADILGKGRAPCQDAER